jgi:isoleucyl-tRNA synthetase
MKKEDYSHTLNLPRTGFKMKASLPQKEPSIQKFWEENDIYHKMLAKGKKKYILHDGPPYANGDIHLGQAVNKILKDIVIKNKSIEGYSTPFVTGWDCHGLPVELQLFKKLKIRKKEEVDILKFRKKARDYAQIYVDRQRTQFKRLGVMAEWESPYTTMSYDYESKIIDAFRELAEKGYVYLDKKPIYWCISCETALAEAEVEYAIHRSSSIFVKFALSSEKDKFIIIWTTTPWTLPANLAIALHPEYEYAWVEIKNKKSEKWLIAKDLVNQVMEQSGIKNYKITEVNKGKDLEELEYSHPLLDKKCTVVTANYVTLEEGTGCVHTAPGHGQEDYITGLKYKLPIFSPVDEKGFFTAEVPQFKGIRVFEANEKIIEALTTKDLLIKSDILEHSYPHCWRCKKPVIFRACKQWFIGVDRNKLREKALKSIKKVKWAPEISVNRIEGMLKTRPDWCLSRQRLWGVGIPAVYCKKCGKEILDSRIMKKVSNTVKKEGADAWFKYEVGKFLPEGFSCPKCGNKPARNRKAGGKNFRKEKDIFDVWLDSGISHLAVLKNSQKLNWPADLYLEGSDQHRGWFQTSLLTSIALYEEPPYRAVLTHGFVVDSEGKKMSKSLGNVTDPQIIVNDYGADILRLWCVSSDWETDIRIGEETLKRCIESYRKFRNTARFILGNLYDFEYSQNAVPQSKWLEIDGWAYNRCLMLLETAKEAYQNFQFIKAYQAIYQFSNVDMSSIYLDILKDRLYILPPDSLERRSAQTVLYFILRILTQLIAPFISFTAEEIWQNFNFKEKSVFLTNLPTKQKIDKKLDSKWKKILNLREVVQKSLEEARQKGIIGSSLEAEVVLYVKDSYMKSLGISKEDLATVFITSNVKIENLGKTTKEIKVKIKKTEGEKCARCWKWSKEVNKIKGFPKLCSRCAKIMGDKKHESK